MKTILYLGNTYCSNIIELKKLIDRSPAQDSLLGKELLCALKDGTLEKWLSEGNAEEQLLVNKLPQIYSGASDSELLRKLGECFMSNYKTQKFDISDFLTLQSVEGTIGDKQMRVLPINGANITCPRTTSIQMMFNFKFKVEKTIGENVKMFLVVIKNSETVEKAETYEINLRELNNTLEISQSVLYKRANNEFVATSKIELVAEFMEERSTIWSCLLSTNVITVNDISFKMVYVEGGTFNMGEGVPKIEPVHSVTLTPFLISETQVTQELWEAVLGKNPSTFKGKLHPVENISWRDCQIFISKLNEISGLSFRLPTEAEWEYSAKGGNKTLGYPRYSGGSRLKMVGWYETNSNWCTHPVKKLEPNELGIYDMCGNVYEWCNDIYESYSEKSQINPRGPEQGRYRVLRGGSYYSDPSSCSHNSRCYQGESKKQDTFGLRLAMDA